MCVGTFTPQIVWQAIILFFILIYFFFFSVYLHMWTSSLVLFYQHPHLTLLFPTFSHAAHPVQKSCQTQTQLSWTWHRCILGLILFFFFFPFLFLHFFFTPFHNCILMYCHQPQMMWQQIRVARAAFTGNVHFGGKRRTALKTVYVAKRLFNFIISWVFN